MNDNYSMVQSAKTLKSYASKWKVVDFEKIIEDVSSGNKKLKKSEYEAIGDLPVVDQGQDMIAGYTTQEDAVEAKPPYIVFGDHTRIFKHVNFKMALGADGVKLLKIKDQFENECHYKFVYYFFQYLDIPNTGYNRHYKYLKNIKIPLPSLSEQKAIVAKLDRAQRLIDIDKEMLAKYDDLIQSVFLDMFGDPRSNSKKIKTGNLGDYAFINMGQSPKGSSYNEEGDGEPLLNGPTEFGEKYPKEKQWTTEPKKFAETDDILFCVRGATAGRTNLADKKYCIGRGLAAIRGEEKLDTTFIHFVLKSHYDYFQNRGQGSTFINIAKKDLSNLLVPIPSQETQNEFISASKKIENQKQITKASQKKSEELFSSLVQKAFR